MDHLPINLDIKGRQVLIDGGGTIAARRAERALSAGAIVHIFDPDPGDEVSRLLDKNALIVVERLPGADDVATCAVVYGASEDRARNQALYDWSRASKVLCNIADVPEMCDFITPSIVDRSPLVIAVSTGGTAPVIARILRARFEASIPAGFGKLADFVHTFRASIAKAIGHERARRHFWERMIDGPAGDLFLNGDEDAAAAQIQADLAAHHAGDGGQKDGEVYLVGAGPGDPDLLTFRALRLMQRCDVVLYDRLIGDDVLALVRRDAQRIYVGKLPKEHTMSQADISALMVRLAQQGKRVLRLKGGDPFIFGRGGEEMEVLAQAKVRFQVVPGITAASGCGAYAGIPLTHRDHAQSCLFVTAHGKDGVLEVDWQVLIRPAQTVAIYMGLSNIPALVAGFADRGVDLNTLVAVIENGTRHDQKVVTGQLADIEARIEKAGIKGPAMIIIGSVVSLREALNWTSPAGASHQMGLSPGKIN